MRVVARVPKELVKATDGRWYVPLYTYEEQHHGEVLLTPRDALFLAFDLMAAWREYEKKK